MKIKELNIIEFGCLKNRKLSFDDGVNVIYGENESGKSTVFLFIRFMLYGLPKKSAKSYDRERSLSFDGHRAVGVMTVEHDGRQYRIERQALLATRMSETVSITDSATGEQIDGEAWELFLGVPVEVFENTCCASQMHTSDINRTATSGAIENILASADESIDVKRVLDRLDAVRKEYKLIKGDGGRLYDTERQISDLKVKQGSAMEKYLSFNEMKARLDRKTEELSRATSELEDYEKTLNMARNAEILQRFDRLSEDRTKIRELEIERDKVKDKTVFGDFTLSAEHLMALDNGISCVEQSRQRREQRNAEYQKLPRIDGDEALFSLEEKIRDGGGKNSILFRVTRLSKKVKGRFIAATIFLCLGVASGIVGAASGFLVSFRSFVTIPQLALSVGFLAIGVVLLTVGVVMLFMSHRAKKQRSGICDEYGCEYGQLEEHLSECIKKLEDIRANKEKTVAAITALDIANEDLRAATARLTELLSLTNVISNDNNDLCLLARAECQRLSQLLAMFEETERKIYGLNAVIKSGEESLSDYDESSLRAMVGSANETLTVAEAERRFKFCRAKKEGIERDVNATKQLIAGQQAVLSEAPTEISDKIRILEEKLRRDTEYYNALMLAKQSIEQASTAMSGNITPVIGKRAGEMLARISDGRHEKVQTTKNLDLSVEQDGFNVSSELLSGGTKDAAYICLRISLMLRLFGDEIPPFILDEALCQMDDGRVRNVIELLEKLGKDGLQTLLFTCHTREREMCVKANILEM